MDVNQEHVMNRVMLGEQKLLIVGGSPLLRCGIAAALADEDWLLIVEMTGDASRTRQLCAEHKTLFVVLDLEIVGNGIGLARELLRLAPHTRILALGEKEDPASVQRAFRAGIHGYVGKQDETHELGNGLRKLWLGGEQFIGERLEIKLMRQVVVGSPVTPPASSMELLSPREQEVFQLVGRGRGTSLLAEDLGVSVKTIETHYRRIKEKLDIHSSADLKRHATECELSQIKIQPANT